MATYMILPQRPRRNRKSSSIRNMLRENKLSVDDLIMPLFVMEGHGQKIPIKSMPGQYRYSLDKLLEKIRNLVQLNIPCVCLFPVIPDHLKSTDAREALNENGLYPRALKSVKDQFPDLTIMTDIALDPYSSDGHDGLLSSTKASSNKKKIKIMNDETVEILKDMALLQAKSGSDILGPSDMMDGRIGAIRRTLEEQGYTDINIISYTVKYASSFYHPFRDALDSTPKKGNKKTYQMDFCNSREALKEAKLDEMEGADALMVKPGLAYLDIIYQLKQSTYLPIAAYNVSGEYAMIKAADEKGWLDSKKIMLESLSAFKRAGADIILTYFAEEIAQILN